MSALILPSRRVVQPQGPVEVDSGSPLAPGLVLAHSGTDLKAIRGELLASGGSVTSATAVGRAQTYETFSSTRFAVQPFSSSSFTILYYGFAREPVPFRDLMSLENAAGTLSYGVLELPSGDGMAVYEISGPGDLAGGAGLVNNTGKPVVAVARVSNNVPSIFVNGVQQSGTVVNFTGGNTVASVRLHERTPGGRFAKGDEVLSLVFRRALSDGEIRALSENPWQVFRPIQRRIIVDMGAGGATNYNLTADVGAYSLTGIDATLTYTPAAVNYSLTADAGAYALTGVDAGVTFGRRLLADAGSYSLTGIDATLAYVPGGGAFTLTADTGAYSLTGNDAGLTFARSMTADTGSYTLNGVAADLKLARNLTADAGVYSLAGVDADLIYTQLGPTAYTLTAETGSYAVAGNVAGLTYTDGGVVIDTHDGFWAKEWARIRAREKRKYREEVEERIEAIADEIEEVEQQIAEVKQVPKPKKFVAARDFYAEQARIVEQLIARRNQLIDEEDEELLLLL